MNKKVHLRVAQDVSAEIHLAFTHETICKLLDLNLNAIVHEFNSLQFEARTNQDLLALKQDKKEQ
jgi:hypothetical protein